MKKAVSKMGVRAGIIAALCLFTLSPAPAVAAYMSSAELARLCLSDKSDDNQACINYIAGVVDYHILMQSLGTAPTMEFCLPPSITKEQAAILVMRYLQVAPQHDDFVAASAVPLALNKALPCARKPPARRK